MSIPDPMSRNSSATLAAKRGKNKSHHNRKIRTMAVPLLPRHRPKQTLEPKLHEKPSKLKPNNGLKWNAPRRKSVRLRRSESRSRPKTKRDKDKNRSDSSRKR